LDNNNSHCDVANKKTKRMKTKELVKELLINKPHLRDDDNKLICTYWWRELKKRNIDPNKINGLEFMQMFANNKLTNIKTIERMRRKLQEEHPELRGITYKARKGVIQDQWKTELGYKIK
tara:strand:- start:287 stop:646 length:360 start_codon:yes stop_codon:yes gene_type:complete